MAAYYNEFDRNAADWLRELMKEGLIADGEVDERSIEDVCPEDLRGFTQAHFFAGIGGWSYALRMAGWPDHRPVWTGSCPCQPFSVAGKGKAEADERHLWPAFCWLIQERRPPAVFGEQVASKLGRAWLSRVRADLEELGYGVGAADLCAAGVGAPQIRQRLFFGGMANSEMSKRRGLSENIGGRRASETGRSGGTPIVGQADNIRNGSSAGLPKQELREERKPEKFNDGSYGNPWAESIFWPCTDGKHRRIPCRLVDIDSGRREQGEPPTSRTRHGQAAESASSNDSGLENSPRIGRGGRNDGGQAGEGWTLQVKRHSNDNSSGIQQVVKIEPIFQFMADGLWDTMGDSWTEVLEKAKERLISYAEKTNRNPRKILRTLRKIHEKKIHKRTPGGPWCFSQEEVLFVALLQLQRALGNIQEGKNEREQEKQGASVRTVREGSPESKTAARSPHERGLVGQQAGELRNLVHILSHEASQCTEAKEIIEAAFFCFPLAGKIPGRVGLLRGAGNAIVPQVAAEFIKAFEEAANAGT